MSQRLKYQRNGRDVVSAEFDFEAMCRVNDNHSAEQSGGILRICSGAVEYLFEKAGESADAAAPEDMARMCREIWDMYAEAMTPPKKSQAAKTEEAAS